MNETQQSEEWEIKAPAFSVTKFASFAGIAVGAVLAAVPSSLSEDQAVVIASIAAGTLIMLGIFVLVAVDIMMRQRAQEAKRRWPTKAEKAKAKSGPAVDLNIGDLVFNMGGKEAEPDRAAQPAAGGA